MKPLYLILALLLLIVLASCGLTGCQHRQVEKSFYLPAGAPAILSKDCKLKADGVTPAELCKVKVVATTIVVK